MNPDGVEAALFVRELREMTESTTTRQIFKSAATCPEEVRDLIQFLFACELLAT